MIRPSASMVTIASTADRTSSMPASAARRSASDSNWLRKSQPPPSVGRTREVVTRAGIVLPWAR